VGESSARTQEELVRRGLASLLLGLSLIAASVAWSGLVLLNTALDPGRSERLADELLDNALLQGVIVDLVADSIERGLPAGVTVPRDELRAAATTTVADPRVEAAVRDGMVRAHRNALEGVEEPVTLDPGAFGSAARDALLADRPELAPLVPAAPSLAVTLPTTGLGFLGTVRSFLLQVVNYAALAALAGATVALVVSRHRPGVLRRVALWAIAASAFWLLIGYGAPWLAERFVPSSAAIFAASVQVLLGAMIPPALLLAGAGAALIVVSLLWDLAAGADRAAPAPAHPRRPVARPSPQAPAPVAGPVTAGVGSMRGVPTTWSPRPDPDPWDLTRPVAVPRPRTAPLAADDPWSVTFPDRPPTERPRSAPRWVEGRGYVDE
jgi:hypothetical protein